MKPLILNAEYLINPNTLPDLDKHYEIHFTRFGKNQKPGGEVQFYSDAPIRVFVNSNEPSTSAWVEQAEHVIQNQHHYTKIITSNQIILNQCSNAVKMPYGTTWLNKSPHHTDSIGVFTEDLGTIKKENSVSMVCGSLTGKHGYHIRHLIWYNQNKIDAQLRFYSSTRFPIFGATILPDDNKIHLFNSMYSVVVESSSELNYFTEKLIDCLITKTIPIYWGCPNISEYFDTSYWISAEDILDKKYTEEYYYNNIDKINANYEKAKQYCKPLLERILNVI